VHRLLTAIGVTILLLTPTLRAAQQEDVVGQAVTITLSNGTKVSGTVTKREGGKVTLKADLIGEIVIDEKDIAGFGPAAAAAPSQVAPAQATAPMVKWTTTGTIGYTFVSGAAPLFNVGDTHGVNVSAFTERASPSDAVSLTGTYAYQRTLPATAGANNGSLTLAYNRPLNKELTLLSRTSYAKDEVQRIDFRFTNLNGIGFIPIKTKKVHLSLVPGAGFTTSRYDISSPQLAALFAGVKNDAVGYGFFDYLSVSFIPTLTFSQTFLHLHSFTDTGQYVSQSLLALVGMVSPKIGLSISFTSNYDSQLPDPYIKKASNTLTSGIQFKF
jgi:hypothetical protein